MKAAVIRHKARLSAELTRARIRRGFPTLEALVQAIKAKAEPQKPRWIRVNTLKSDLDTVISTFLDGFKKVETVKELLEPSVQPSTYHVDKHIPNLIGLPPSFLTSRITSHKLYQNGTIIIQDKASCMPAVLLSPPEGSTCIDGCAAPGNKTTHLAAICGKTATIVAYERDKMRGKILKAMVEKAGGSNFVDVRVDDFLGARPDQDDVLYAATHILLDPSCSGSGIVSRVEVEEEDPSTDSKSKPNPGQKGPKKRPHSEVEQEEEPEEEEKGARPDRLQQLSTFQKHILTHALAFPNAEKVTYSTCSVHAEENELVVLHSLNSDVAKARGWRLLEREAQGTLKDWDRRGLPECLTEKNVEEKLAKDIAESVIRCDHNGSEGTIGFFVACFVRDTGNGDLVMGESKQPEEEHDVEGPGEPSNDSNKKKKKKKKAKRQKTE